MIGVMEEWYECVELFGDGVECFGDYDVDSFYFRVSEQREWREAERVLEDELCVWRDYGGTWSCGVDFDASVFLV